MKRDGPEQGLDVGKKCLEQIRTTCIVQARFSREYRPNVLVGAVILEPIFLYIYRKGHLIANKWKGKSGKDYDDIKLWVFLG